MPKAGLRKTIWDNEQRFANFSEDRRYRYSLKIVWDPQKPVLVVIGLNPSKADEKRDDATMRRWKGYARSWGFGGLLVLNLFALVSTDPKELLLSRDPVGTENSISTMQSHMKNVHADWALACWGAGPSHMTKDRGMLVTAAIPRLKCLKLNRDGSPAHPLRLNKTLKPRPYNYMEAGV